MARARVVQAVCDLLQQRLARRFAEARVRAHHVQKRVVAPKRFFIVAEILDGFPQAVVPRVNVGRGMEVGDGI
jgi:hypothetical protein